MSLFSLLGAIEIGLIFALVALGVYISFRLLRFPDLTVDGSFPLGGAVCAVMIVAGFNPWIATLGATLAGAAAGLVTGWLNVKLKIMDLLASILMMTALYGYARRGQWQAVACLLVMLAYGYMESQVTHLTSDPALLLLCGAVFALPRERWLDE